MHSITEWIEKKLGFKVNATKTKITRLDGLKYLGFGFYKDFKTDEWKCKPHKDSIEKFKRKLKQLTERRWSINLRVRIAKINQITRGWINYYALGSMKTAMAEMDAHLRTRL